MGYILKAKSKKIYLIFISIKAKKGEQKVLRLDIQCFILLFILLNKKKKIFYFFNFEHN